ncbi:hypothetical protein Tco_0368652 [Tanacetum coccineum]
MTNTSVTILVNLIGAPVTNIIANHAEKLEKFNGQNFKRWQQKMFFYLTTLNLAWFLNETAPQTMTAKELRESLERKYKTEDADQPNEEKVEPRRSKRARIEKSFGPDFVSFMVENEYFLSRSVRMAQWKEAIKSEIDFILQIHTWELVVLLSGCKSLGYKWIFKKKMKADGTIDKYKARLMIKGFRQSEGLGYIDTYSPVTRITSIRMVFAIAALRNLEVHQMDVKPAFLSGDLKEEIYMKQPEGFMALGLESKVCRLVKSLYGLKKAPKQGHQISPYHVRMWIRN